MAGSLQSTPSATRSSRSQSLSGTWWAGNQGNQLEQNRTGMHSKSRKRQGERAKSCVPPPAGAPQPRLAPGARKWLPTVGYAKSLRYDAHNALRQLGQQLFQGRVRHMAVSRTKRLQFDRMRRHLGRLSLAASMFDPKARRKIITKVDHLWWELRKAWKIRVLAELELQRRSGRAESSNGTTLLPSLQDSAGHQPEPLALGSLDQRRRARRSRHGRPWQGAYEHRRAFPGKVSVCRRRGLRADDGGSSNGQRKRRPAKCGAAGCGLHCSCWCSPLWLTAWRRLPNHRAVVPDVYAVKSPEPDQRGTAQQPLVLEQTSGYRTCQE